MYLHIIIEIEVTGSLYIRTDNAVPNELGKMHFLCMSLFSHEYLSMKSYTESQMTIILSVGLYC